MAMRGSGRSVAGRYRLREHPHIVGVHDVVVEDGVPWIVMEYVPSRTPAEVVDEDGPLTVARVRVIGTAPVDARGSPRPRRRGSRRPTTRCRASGRSCAPCRSYRSTPDDLRQARRARATPV
ncbi:hypothetical protein ACFRCG_25440 [Embleya sp. NPDC056575]|uniref:hypothetical protein n=1 Tax=unclassified Embleya TaxID=2699296 RepID=UPI0036B0FB06